MSDRESRIRDEAYRIWVDAGRPDGDEHSYWYEAERRVAESDRANEAAREKLARPVAERTLPAGAAAAGAVAAGAGSAAAKSLSKGAVKGPGAADPAVLGRQPKVSKSEVPGAAAVPAPGPAGAKPKLAKAAAEGQTRAPLKGEAVEVASRRTPKRSGSAR